MLVRAGQRQARRRLARSIISSFEQLQLPWLCPAITPLDYQTSASFVPSTLISGLSHRHTRSTHTRSKNKRKYLSTSESAQSRRTLATATSDLPQYGGPEDYIPFEGISHSTPPYPEPWKQRLADLRPFDARNLLIVPQESETSTIAHVKAGPMSGVSGDVSDLLENIYACTRVGRFDRAAVLVRRLSDIFVADAPELVDAHERYLIGMLDSLQDAPSKVKFGAMQKWLELDVKTKGIEPTTMMLVVMIKASFAVLEGSKLDRTIRRYLAYAADSGVQEEITSSEEFSVVEFAHLLRLQPQQYQAPHEDISEVSALAYDPSHHTQSSMANAGVSQKLASDVDLRQGISDLQEVEQKGLGLKVVKSSLNYFYMDGQALDSDEKTQTTYQERLEQDVLDATMKRWRDEAENASSAVAKDKMVQSKLGGEIHHWIQAMIPLVQAEIKFCESIETNKLTSGQAQKVSLLPFLKLIPLEKMCATAVISYIKTICDNKNANANTNTTSVGRVVATLGKDMAVEIQTHIIADHTKNKLKKLNPVDRRKKVAMLARKKMPNNKFSVESPSEFQKIGSESSLIQDEWWEKSGVPSLPATRVKVGALFLSFLIKVAKLPVSRLDARTGKEVTEIQPVANHSWVWKNGRKLGVITTNIELLERLKKEPLAARIAKHLPMITPPKKWTGLWDGGYLRTRTPAVRFKDTSASQNSYLKLAANRGDMKQVFAGLDVLGAVPWRINAPLFKVQTALWNTGEAIADFAPLHPKAEFPPEPPKTDYANRLRWKELVKSIHDQNTGYHTQRCYQNAQLEVARAYLNVSFYTPHSVDFRGRAYPIPPYFNHMGQDFVRGLFLFANGKELGQTGLAWLKIHLANTYGYDKQSLQDRERFTMEHLAQVYNSAENPLEGKRWWLSAEDPWQCLAACMELRNALESPVPSQFVSHLPVQQDGTCNGLQHYAALGGDEIGATQVNLMPGDRPADIYSAVADLVREEVAKDAAAGNMYAKALDGKIARKIVKQPVMTNVYGVTYHGARAQVKKQLVEIMPKATLDTTVNLNALSGYVATQIFSALSKMFNGAHAIQQWLGDCGGRIAQSVTPEQIERLCQTRKGLKRKTNIKKRLSPTSEAELAKEDYQFKQTIVWTTPLGMPVVQPYRDSKFTSIRTTLQHIQVKHARLSDPVHKRKQLQAFPPNFIHSLDATHMMLSALKCHEIGLTFSSVHDSFWTHAGDIPNMNRVLRDAFILMHSEDIVGRLREEFIARYKGCIRSAAVHKESDAAQKIMALRIAKGRHASLPNHKSGIVTTDDHVDELIEERERLKFLQSEDPAERQQGLEMVTPWSIVEADPEAHRAIVSDENLQFLGDKNEAASEDGALVEDNVFEPDEGDAESNVESVLAKDDINASIDSSEAPKKTRMKAAVMPAVKDHKIHQSQYVTFWMPLEFAPAPKKGSFDVSKLKQSQYFFS